MAAAPAHTQEPLAKKPRKLDSPPEAAAKASQEEADADPRLPRLIDAVKAGLLGKKSLAGVPRALEQLQGIAAQEEQRAHLLAAGLLEVLCTTVRIGKPLAQARAAAVLTPLAAGREQLLANTGLVPLLMPLLQADAKKKKGPNTLEMYECTTGLVAALSRSARVSETLLQAGALHRLMLLLRTGSLPDPPHHHRRHRMI
eukprot:TRINITY_DN23586_c0_g1_i2.p1 TRINITY_DN23586_c0_g1~~TRINITY_DN23586_c0_g1_i2.p1  ORF type:complete len:200 (+),score=45.72 TRINITY_DN23586_c0_g1_i2:63-662(+)